MKCKPWLKSRSFYCGIIGVLFFVIFLGIGPDNLPLFTDARSFVLTFGIALSCALISYGVTKSLHLISLFFTNDTINHSDIRQVLFTPTLLSRSFIAAGFTGIIIGGIDILFYSQNLQVLTSSIAMILLSAFNSCTGYLICQILKGRGLLRSTPLVPESMNTSKTKVWIKQPGFALGILALFFCICVIGIGPDNLSFYNDAPSYIITYATVFSSLALSFGLGNIIHFIKHVFMGRKVKRGEQEFFLNIPDILGSICITTGILLFLVGIINMFSHNTEIPEYWKLGCAVALMTVFYGLIGYFFCQVLKGRVIQLCSCHEGNIENEI